jgi:hypothetical protein
VSYTFHRWTRFGVAASLSNTAVNGPRARVTVTVDVTAGGNHSLVQNDLGVFGPGDVARIDTRQIIRTFPIAGTGDFEPTHFAHIELDRPDLPWLFTPTAPDTNNLLRPWFCLIVVEVRDGVTLDTSSPQPVLSITSGAAAELPSLATISTYAHVQITGDASAGPQAIASQSPERILSRIICPRVLNPNTSYMACLVPTYDVGVAAGLGQDVAANASIGDAWAQPAPDSIKLPVYFHWEFSTGGSGDFKTLVMRLQPHALGTEVGTRKLDITSPGFGVADLPASTEVDFGGALRVVAPADPPIDTTLAQRLAPVVNATQTAVGPPIYGRWHAAAPMPAGVAVNAIPGWLDTLNLDVRYRVAAGLGTQIVQQRQEDLMAAIWDQFGEIVKANQLLRQAQLAIATAQRVVDRHLDVLPAAASLLSMTGPALARISVAPGKTARRKVVESCLPLSALSGAFRRITRAHGPLERRVAHRARVSLPDRMPTPSIDVPTLLANLARGALNAPAPHLPDGAVAVPAELMTTHGRLPITRTQPPAALTDLLRLFAKLAARDVTAACTPLDIGALTQLVQAQIDPTHAIPPRVLQQINLPADRILLSPRLDPIMAAPEITTPMIGPLIELGPDYLLPGLTQLPPNTLSIVQPDAEFIEAYFVGLNHEIGREMLWRGFPTDQRGTVFSRFWDRRGAIATNTAPVPDKDITAIAGWTRNEALGTHLTTTASNPLVLLIRGDLLVRYPRVTLFMQQARWQRDTSNAIVYDDNNVARRERVPVQDAASWDQYARFPSFSGRTGSDTMFMGFMVDKEDAHGIDRTDVPPDSTDSQAGWYIVIQEQPTEPRFGPTGSAITATQSEVVAVSLLQPPFRLFVHASDLMSA